MKLELGGGDNPKRPEFTNCDARELPGVDRVIDLEDRGWWIDFDDASVDEIFSAHCLEHFQLKTVKDILQECFQVLLPGGKIELIVPNVRRLAERYIRGEYDCETFSHMIYGGQDYEQNFHKIGFDFSWLAKLLDEAGFVGIKQVQCEDINEFGIEARKPGGVK